MPLRVLLITPVFYGIEKRIKSALEESGYEVIWIENKTLTFDYHGTKSKLRFIRRLYFLLFSPHIRYIRKELNRIKNTRFDILFSINGHIICPYLFRKLKNKNPGLYSVLYLWDAFSMYDWIGELKLFNRVLTFDSSDSERFGIEYKPIFYVKSVPNSTHECDYDLFFAGRFNSYRLELVDKILKLVDNSEIKYFVKLWPSYKILFHNRLIYNIIRKINLKTEWIRSYLLNFEAYEGKLGKDYIIGNSMSFEEIQNHFLRSNVILNLPYHLQAGYSFGLIEALANGKKIITTNSNIMNEIFYNSKQIHIISSDNPELDCNWIKEKAIFPSDSYFSDLELTVWLKSLMNVRIA